MNTETGRTPSRRTRPSPLAERTVAEFASVGILSVAPDAPLAEVAWQMANNRVHAVVVSDERAADPPVIADADLIAAADSGHFDELGAGDIAATEAVDVSEDETLERAAQLLAEHGVSHLVVRGGRRTPVGILSTLDVARALARRD
jgi:predicted transcriptional regulator